jgi:hypothetical protein
MNFRSNEIGHGPNHVIVCRNDPIMDKHVGLGKASNVTKVVLLFVPWLFVVRQKKLHNKSAGCLSCVRKCARQIGQWGPPNLTDPCAIKNKGFIYKLLEQDFFTY